MLEIVAYTFCIAIVVFWLAATVYYWRRYSLREKIAGPVAIVATVIVFVAIYKAVYVLALIGMVVAWFAQGQSRFGMGERIGRRAAEETRAGAESSHPENE